MSDRRPPTGLARDLRAAELLSDLAHTRRGIVELQTRTVRRDLAALGTPAGLGSAFGLGVFAGLLRGPSREEVALRKMDTTLDAIERRLGRVEGAHRPAEPSRGRQIVDIARSLATTVIVRYLAGALLAERTAADTVPPDAAAAEGTPGVAAEDWGG